MGLCAHTWKSGWSIIAVCAPGCNPSRDRSGPLPQTPLRVAEQCEAGGTRTLTRTRVEKQRRRLAVRASEHEAAGVRGHVGVAAGEALAGGAGVALEKAFGEHTQLGLERRPLHRREHTNERKKPRSKIGLP